MRMPFPLSDPGSTPEALTFAEAEKSLLLLLEEQPKHRGATLQRLCQLYAGVGRHDLAIARLREVFAMPLELEFKAACAVAMGCHAEEAGDFLGAVSYYQETLSLKPTNPETIYFANNNLGYSLNQLGRFVEGEAFCRGAIPILPERSNAHKNLGLALAGQGRWRDAAACYVEATRVRPTDPRSSVLLEELLRDHTELAAEFGEAAQTCRKAVGGARAWTN